MLEHCTARIVLGPLLAAAVVFGQTAAPSGAPLSFEVASVKLSAPLDMAAIQSGKAHIGTSIDQARVDIGNANLLSLICAAYKVKPFQITGNPDWLNGGMSADRFDILAKMPEGSNKDQVPEMLKSLLAERFKLALHHDTREVAVYALVVAKGGPKLKEADPEPAAAAETNSSQPPAKGEMSFGSGDSKVTMKQSGGGMVMNSKETGAIHMSPGENGAWRMEVDRLNMEGLAGMLSQYLDRPVEDRTELKAKYQVSLELSMETLLAAARRNGMDAGMVGAPGGSGRPADSATDPSGGSLFNAVQKLGLKLESRKMPYDSLVIDHIEKRPTEN